MSDTAPNIAFNDAAPADERYEAQAELQKSALADALLPNENIQPVINHIVNDLAEQEMNKAIQDNFVPFAPKNRGEPGMQSVFLDDFGLVHQGSYWEKPSALSFDSMKSMVEQTPVLNAVIMTRQRQIQRFCRVQESGEGPGFTVRHIDKDHQVTADEKKSIELLNRFFLNCGWEFSPRARKRLRRDNFSQFMSKVVRDSLTLDAVAIETEMKRNRALGIDGFYAVDGATIRLCTDEGYNGDDEIFALQVVQGRIRTAYGFDDLIYEPRNVRTDVMAAGYGLSETELLIRVVTGFLNAMSYNISGFDNNAIPKGMLHLYGNYSQEDVAVFKRYWNAMVKGVNNSWALPVMVSKDQESGAKFEPFGVEYNEMYFSKWMSFLVSIICAIYGMSPDEINFEAFSSQTSSLSGSDTAEKLADSKDKGLRPLLSYFENTFSDFILSDFSDKYVFRFTGLDPEDQDKRHEMRKLVLTVNEARAQEGYDKLDSPLGEAPLNPSLMGAWQQIQQAQAPEDFGQPGGGDEQGAQPGQDAPGGDMGQPEGDSASQDDEAQQQAPSGQDTDANDAAPDFGQGDDAAKDFGKSFGLPPIYEIEP